jgi:hypothetical protein
MTAIDLRIVLQRTVSSVYGDLVTRRTGQAVRCGVEALLADFDGEQVAIIDFSSVRLLDLSCADEIVAKLLLQHGRARPFLLRGVTEDHRDAIEPVLERHGLAAVAEDRDGGLRLLGIIPERVRTVFAILAERGTARLEDVAEYLSVPQDAVRELFDELLQRRLALADAGGRQVFVLA